MSARGFSLIELLLASALLLMITAAIVTLTTPLRDVLERSQASADLEGGGRVALDQIAADLRHAGGEPSVAAFDVRLWRTLARVLPGADAVQIRYVPHLAAQGVTAVDAGVGDRRVHLDVTTRCRGGAPACGFRPHDSIALLTTETARLATIDSIGHGFVMLGAPLTAPLPVDAVVSELTSVTYAVRDAGDGSQRLVRITGGGAEQPMLDNIVFFAVSADSDDPLQVQRISIRLRVQAASAALRGPAGLLFRHGGTARHARRWLPDVELEMVVALRSRTGAS
jgi:prepilin-type N-terminal cleavage/methylation domain-containing protein